MLINIVGSLAMGLFIGYLARFTPSWQADARLFVAVGIFGGFTTFSSFSLDAIAMFERGEVAQALFYVVGSVVIGIAALYGGLVLMRGMRMSGVRQQTVARDEDGMRLDRWFGVHFPRGDVRASAEADPDRAGADRLRPGQDQFAPRGRATGARAAARGRGASASSRRSTTRMRRSCAI